jgi:hypothetical protein
MARFDGWLGRRTTFGAAFVVLVAEKPARSDPAPDEP